jgi:hypothetical protein
VFSLSVGATSGATGTTRHALDVEREALSRRTELVATSTGGVVSTQILSTRFREISVEAMDPVRFDFRLRVTERAFDGGVIEEWISTSPDGMRFQALHCRDGRLAVVGAGPLLSQLNTVRVGVWNSDLHEWAYSTLSGAPEYGTGCAITWIDNRVFVWGGVSLGGKAAGTLRTGGLYNPARNTWTLLSAPFGIEPRSDAGVSVHDGVVLISGGIRIPSITEDPGEMVPVCDCIAFQPPDAK